MACSPEQPLTARSIYDNYLSASDPRARYKYSFNFYTGKCVRTVRKSAHLDTKIRFGRSAAVKSSIFVLCNC